MSPLHQMSARQAPICWLVAALLLFSFAQSGQVFADDCDNWGRLVHVGEQSGDSYCFTRIGPGGSTTKQLEDARDYDYFLFYVGYDEETPVNEQYQLLMTNTSLSRPMITVSTFYDDAGAFGGQTGTEVWYSEYSSHLSGMTLDEFKGMVTLAPNLLHDGVYDYVDGEVVVVQESSDAAIREMFYAVPVGTVIATNQRNDNPETPQSEKFEVVFSPPDRGAYLVVVSNYSTTRRRGTLTGGYTLSISLD